MLKIQLNNSNHRRIEFTEKSSHSLNYLSNSVDKKVWTMS